jgi:hypothetical protein
VSRVACAPNPEAAVMKSLSDEPAAVLWRYAMRLTSAGRRAEGTVQKMLLGAGQHPEVVVASSLDDSNTLEQLTLHKVTATLGVTR